MCLAAAACSWSSAAATLMFHSWNWFYQRSLESAHCVTERFDPKTLVSHLKEGWVSSLFISRVTSQSVFRKTLRVYLTVGGADEGEAGHNPQEGHGDDDVLKERAALLSLHCAGPQPIRELAGLSSSAAYQTRSGGGFLTSHLRLSD